MRSERAFILALVVLTLACTSKPDGPEAEGPVVARVGAHAITKAYYEERLQRMDRQFLPDTLDMAGRHKFLDYIINKEILALKSQDLGYADDPVVKEAYRTMSETIIHTKSVELAIQDHINVTEEDIQTFYDNSKEDVLVKHILLATRGDAEAVVSELRAGADFDSLADAHTLIAPIANDGTEVPLQKRIVFGWLEYGKANPEVESVIFSTPLNEYSDPVQTTYGWHVFMPVERRERKLQPYEEMRDRIETQIQGRMRRSATNNYYDSILAEHNFVEYDDAMSMAHAKLLPDSEEEVDPRAEVKPAIDYTYEERETPLFELDGKTYTIGDFSDRYDNTPWPERPRKWTGTQGLHYWIRDVWFKPLQIERALKDGVDKVPEIADDLALRREMLMVGKLHSTLIANEIPEPTEEQIQATYEKHSAAYAEKEKRVCNLIFHVRERVVRRAYEEIQEGSDFVETAIRYNDNAVSAEHVRTVAFSEDDERHQELVAQTFALELNEYSEPFKTSQGWVIVQVHQIIPRRAFALEDIRDVVIQDWKTEWSEARLNELLEEWKQEYPITVDEEVLSQVKVERDDVYVPLEGLQEGSD
jgi:parvulin-like peptidyl-prolyl isomerase